MSTVSWQDDERSNREPAERRAYVSLPPGRDTEGSAGQAGHESPVPLHVLLVTGGRPRGETRKARGTRPGIAAADARRTRPALAGAAVVITRVQDVPGVVARLRGGPAVDALVIDLEAAGAPALDELRRAAAALPVVALVGSSRQGQAAVQQGAHAYLRHRRPGPAGMDTADLLDAVHHAMQVHGLRRERDAAREQLIHADRLASLGQLTAGVAHEINNPTAFLLTNLETMKDRLARALGAREPSPCSSNEGVALRLRELAEIVDESLEGIGQLRSIVKDLRTFSRSEAGGIEADQITPVDLHHVIQSACKLTHNTIASRARLVKDLQPVPRIMGNQGKLVQVFVNLLTNAAHAIDQGTPQDNEIRVCTRERDGVVIAAVEDTGCGIPEEVRPLVFAPFFTTKPRDQGNGLGLSLSADIVRALGGELGFEPRAPRGTRFELRLATARRAAPVSVRVPGRAARAGAGHPWRARVLLVDDEPGMLRAYRRVLAPRHEVVMAAGGQQALDILARDTDFDAVICDFLMPGVDGIMVHEAVARKDPELASRIVFCTGGAVSHRARAFVQATSNTVLEKPVAPERLLGAIEQLERRPPCPTAGSAVDAPGRRRPG